MLWRSSEIDGYQIAARDGAIGSVDDMLFDEARWTVRWLVVDTGRWLSGRRVLLPPTALGHPDIETHTFPVDLTREQVESSPPFESDRPVSRQLEAGLYDFYGWSPYWTADLMPPLGYLSGGAGSGFLYMPEAGEPVSAESAGNKPHAPPPAEHRDPTLFSIGDTTGHGIRASDGDIGHVEDFLIEEEGWRVRYMIVDTRNWLAGRKVLISPQWISAVDWPERRVHVDLTRAAIEHSPEFDSTRPLARDYEDALHGHYGKPGYWAED
jgi:PRC-barrel domain